MTISYCFNLFHKKYIMNNLHRFKNVQLWHFPITKNNILNYEYEKNQYIKDKSMIWSSPDTFDKYINFTNMCLVTHKNLVEIFIIKKSNIKPRNHWDLKHHKNTIDLELIGILGIPSNDVATKLCNYKRWNISGKFQPIKKINYNEFKNNIMNHL